MLVVYVCFCRSTFLETGARSSWACSTVAFCQDSLWQTIYGWAGPARTGTSKLIPRHTSAASSGTGLSASHRATADQLVSTRAPKRIHRQFHFPAAGKIVKDPVYLPPAAADMSGMVRVGRWQEAAIQAVWIA